MNCDHPLTLTLLTASGTVTWCQQCGALHIDGCWQYPHRAHDTERPPPPCGHERTTSVYVHEGSDREAFVGTRCLECDRVL